MSNGGGTFCRRTIVWITWWRKVTSQAVEEGKRQRKPSQQWQNRVVILDELKVCSRTRNLKRGKEIHAEAMETGNRSCNYVATALINMYAKCSSMVDARQVFDGIKQPDVVSWNALILGYAENREGLIALDLFARMTCVPDSRTFVAAIKACTSLALERDERGKTECRARGKQMHMMVGCHLNIYVQNSLIDMYSKCGSMVEARKVFDSLKLPNVVSWNTLLLGYTELGQGAVVLDLFAKMKYQGCPPDAITFVAALKACTSVALDQNARKAECLERGRAIHSQIGCHLEMYLYNTLIDMYAKCGSMIDAHCVFDSMKQPDVVSWNALISGYAEEGEGAIALDLLRRMTCAPDSITFVAALKACTSFALGQEESGKRECRERGKEIHSKVGCHLNIYVQNTLIDMYSKCGNMDEARKVFDSMKNPNVLSWTSLILGYVQNGEGITALDVFTRLRSQGCPPDGITFVAAIKACTSLIDEDEGGIAECLQRGKKIHSQIGCHLDIYVQSALIDMYSKCGCMTEAHQVFDGVKHPDLFLWTPLILGYALNGEGYTALEMFARMRSQGCPPDCITYAAALKACGMVSAFEFGKKIHAELDTRTEWDTILVTSLVDFYGKCGNMVEAQKVFDKHHGTRDLITWNSLLAGYSRLGDNKAVFKLFQGIKDAGFHPNDVTFLCVLTSCSHAGLVGKAYEFFEAMSTKYRFAPAVEHYSCMVDILGRSNKMDDVMALLRSMPFRPSVMAWMTVLGACLKWKNVWIGNLAFNSLVSLDDKSAAGYVLMEHLYESKGMWEEHKMVLGMRHEVYTFLQPDLPTTKLSRIPLNFVRHS